MTHKVLIAGGGLSGLHCAWEPYQQGSHWTASSHDRRGHQGHAAGQLPPLAIDAKRLIRVGAETAQCAGQCNGHLEGAFASAHRAAAQIIVGASPPGRCAAS